MKALALILLIATCVEASPESKLVYWGGIEEQQRGEESGRERGKDVPFLASLKIRSKLDNSVWFGSGALIADGWVITAKHVAGRFVEMPDAFGFEVSFRDGTVREAVEAIEHPDRDLAMIKLGQPVKHIVAPAVQGEAMPPLLGRDGFPVTITGATGGFIAYDVIGYSDDDRLFAPDILRGGDSGSPVIGQDTGGGLVILGTLVGPYRLNNDGQNRFIQNMSYAQFVQIGGLKEWITEKMKSKSAVKWSRVPHQFRPDTLAPVYRGTPEYQLNQAAYLFFGRRPREAKAIVVELLPRLKGRMRESIATELLKRCEQAVP